MVSPTASEDVMRGKRLVVIWIYTNHNWGCACVHSLDQVGPSWQHLCIRFPPGNPNASGGPAVRAGRGRSHFCRLYGTVFYRPMPKMYVCLTKVTPHPKCHPGRLPPCLPLCPLLQLIQRYPEYSDPLIVVRCPLFDWGLKLPSPSPKAWLRSCLRSRCCAVLAASFCQLSHRQDGNATQGRQSPMHLRGSGTAMNPTRPFDIATIRFTKGHL